MKLKHTLPFIIFCSITFGLFIWFYLVGELNSMAWFSIVPMGYGIAHILRSLHSLIIGEKKSSLHLFFTSVLYFLIAIKIVYIWYNFIIVAFILILIYYFYYKKGEYKATKLIKNNTTILFLMVFNTILLFIPNTSIFKLITITRDQRTLWSEDISWKDFQGYMPDSIDYVAVIESEFIWKTNKVYNYPQAILLSTLEKDKSWRDTITLSELEDNLLLRHEQYHFNILELYRRKAEDSISKVWFRNDEEIQSIINYFGNLNETQQVLYDSLTDHSLIREEQTKWETRIGAELGIDQAQPNK